MAIERRAGAFETWVLRDETSEVQVVPERGALVTRWSVGDRELLFLDEATLADVSKNVRGGIPLLFPNAGPLPSGGVELGGRRITQPQHGLARRLPWTVTDAISDDDTARLSMRLASNAETKVGYPFDFISTFDVSLVEGRLLLEWAFRNTGEVPMPVHAGLHPYFKVPVEQKSSAQVPSTAATMRDRRTGAERAPAFDLGIGEVDVALLDHGPAASLVLADGRIELNATPQLSTLVVWTLEAQPFICVEPWTAAGGALERGEALWVPAGAVERLAVELRFTR